MSLARSFLTSRPQTKDPNKTAASYASDGEWTDEDEEMFQALLNKRDAVLGQSSTRASDARSITALATAAAMQAMTAYQVAIAAVRPIVGDSHLQSCRNADQVYAHALGMMGVNIAGVHPSAYPTMLKMANQPQRANDRAKNAPRAKLPSHIRVVS